MTTSRLFYSSVAPTAIKPGHALAVAGAIAPTLSIFAYKGLAPLFFGVAVVELVLFWRDHRRLPRPPLQAALLLGAFVVWGIIGAAWSLDAEARSTAFRLGAGHRSRCDPSGGTESKHGGGSRGRCRGTGLCGCVLGRRSRRAGFGRGYGGGDPDRASSPESRSGPAQEFNWSSDDIPSVYQRIGIWKFAEMRIDERSILGWGLDAARRIPGGDDGIKADSLDIRNPVMRERVTAYFDSRNIERTPLHPHNAALQIWLEAGGVGAALTPIVVFTVLWATAHRWPISRPGTAAALAFAVSALLIAGLSYGIWQTWWPAILWLGATFAQLAGAADASN